VNDATHHDHVTQRWDRALSGYATAVATQLTALRIRVITYFVDVSEVPFWIDLAVVDATGQLVEFYFCDDVGWMQSLGARCGRLTPLSSPTPAEHAARIALPPSRVAAEIVTALAGHPWAEDPSGAAGSQHALDPVYLTTLLAILDATRESI
jgi:hypothetical protein